MNRHPKILMLDRGGIPKDWIDYEDYVRYEVKNKIAWKTDQKTFPIYGGTNAVTGERSTILMSSIFALSGDSNPRFNRTFDQIPLTKKNNDLFARDLHCCAYCSQKFPVRQLSRDHIHPQSKGGKDEWMNIVTACKVCNQEKDDMLLSDPDCHLSLKYVPYIPNKAEMLILSNRNILEDQMEYLLTQVPPDSRLRIQN